MNVTLGIALFAHIIYLILIKDLYSNKLAILLVCFPDCFVRKPRQCPLACVFFLAFRKIYCAI